ncbi:MAG: hypothetical protein D6785_16755 [Planctomycetota bacterium]|nr:MAG: hypothetical protein D6785_16755 [Planctomycetota bacterium]
MKQRKWLLLFLSLILICSCKTVSYHPREISGEPHVVWVGLDFSLVRMIGVNDFRKPKEIFPGYLEKWNNLVLKEQLDDLEDNLGKPILVDIDSVMEMNRMASADQIIRRVGTESDLMDSHITPEMLEEQIKSYKLKETDGIALVFIIDRMVKSQASSAIYIVYFDIRTRKIIYSKRGIFKAGGFGFRNYWFGCIKRAIRAL